MKYTLFLPLIALLSCNKNGDDKKSPDNTELLSSKAWVYESGGADNNKDGNIDISFESSGFVDACLLDNSIKFNADGTGTSDEGPKKCSTSQPQTSTFNWNFTNNGSDLAVTGSGLFGGGSFHILNLSETQLRLAKDTTVTYLSTPVKLTIIANMKH